MTKLAKRFTCVLGLTQFVQAGQEEISGFPGDFRGKVCLEHPRG